MKIGMEFTFLKPSNILLLIIKGFVLKLNIVLICVFVFLDLTVSANNLKPFKLKKVEGKSGLSDPLKSNRVENYRKDINSDDGKTGFRIGFKGGLQLTNSESDQINNTSSFLGFPMGLTVDYNISPYISIGAYINYVTKGANTDSGTTKITFTYLGINPDIKIFPIKKWFFISVGPSLYYHLSSKLSPDTQNVGSNFGADFAFGLHGGLGVFYDIDSIRISLEGKVDYGLSNMINQSRLAAQVSDTEIKFFDYQILLGISYNI